MRHRFESDILHKLFKKYGELAQWPERLFNILNRVSNYSVFLFNIYRMYYFVHWLSIFNLLLFTMKKIILFVCVALLSINGFAQKKKSVTKKSTTTASSLPKLDNLQVEIKNGKFQVTVSEKGKTNDMLIVKDVNAEFAPKD